MIFWLIFAAMFVFITLASLSAFDRRWWRTLIFTSLAVECAWFMCSGLIT